MKHTADNRQAAARRIAQTAVIAAILLAGQVALRVIPNVEIVTMVIIVAAFVFPPVVSVGAAVVFATGEWLIYGFGYWVAAYYIYWPMLAVAATLLKLISKPQLRSIAATVIAVVLTAFFGVLTSIVDAAFASNLSKMFFVYFPIIYMRGIWFYVTHIVSNAVIVSLLFSPLSRALKQFSAKTDRGLLT